MREKRASEAGRLESCGANAVFLFFFRKGRYVRAGRELQGPARITPSLMTTRIYSSETANLLHLASNATTNRVSIMHASTFW